MAKRRRRGNEVLDAIKAFNLAYDTTSKVAQDFELADIAKAEEVNNAAFSEDQGKQLEAAAAGGANITYDQDKKAYVINPADGSAAETVGMAKRGVSFLGKDYDQPLSDGEKDKARMMAMAGVVSKNDPIKGMQFKQQVKQGELTDLSIKQALRGEKKAEREDTYEAGLPDLMKGSRFAQAQADGRKYSIADSLADNATFLAYGAQHGKVDPEKWMNLAQKMEQVEREGYSRALTLADAGGDLKQIADEFNKSGNARFDPANVVSDKMGTIKLRGQDVPTRIIQFKDEKGNIQTINTASELAGLGEAKNLLETHFAVQRDKRDGQRTALAQKADARAAETHAAGAAGRSNTEQIEKLKAINAGLPADSPQRAENVRKINDLAGADKGDGYKTEFSEVSSALGKPAVDRNGKPVVDFATGRQVVNRDPQAEAEFFKWAQDRGIKDTNKALQIYLAEKAGKPAAAGKGQGATGEKPTTEAEYAKLPSGATYIAPDGTRRTKK